MVGIRYSLMALKIHDFQIKLIKLTHTILLWSQLESRLKRVKETPIEGQVILEILLHRMLEHEIEETMRKSYTIYLYRAFNILVDTDCIQ